MSALDIGIDLGTTKVIVYKDGEGEILREPSIIAVNTKDDTIMAVGREALAMLGRTPSHIKAEYPLSGGVISDYRLTEVLIKDCLRRAYSTNLVKHQVVICVPSLITDVEKRTLVEVVINSGGRKVYLIEEPIAAAIGAGVNIGDPNGVFIVDIGGGTTDIAVISLGGVVVSSSIKFAGDKIDEEIIKFVSLRYKLSIGKRMATQIKEQLGNVYAPSRDKVTEARGRNLLTGLPQKITINQAELYDCLIPFGDSTVAAVKAVLESTPPELISDIIDNGILLTGGGSLLGGLAELIEQCTNVKTKIAPNPVECVSIGTGKAFAFIDKLQNGFTMENFR